MTDEQLLKQMEATLENGGEEALERYVIDHFEELPKDIQGQVLTQFMRETVEGSQAVTRVQEEGMAALDAIAALKAEIEKDGSK